jgi:hypothetical protein
MNTELFTMILNKQIQWRQEYYANKKDKRIIRTIYNRKYKSKGNKDINEIHKVLVDMGFLEDQLTMIQQQDGNLCYDSLYGK